ncbi:MAG: hypothetical protein V4608_14905 [Bacteroidota bacterium]
MENTLENKAKFFAQYWGQYLVIMPKISMNIPIHVHHVNLSHIQECVLQLKNLSSITDEDALECYNIHFKGYLDKDIRPSESRINFSKNHIIKPIEVCILEVTDCLRSKGYALPYMGLSVDQLVEYGWIKLDA